MPAVLSDQRLCHRYVPLAWEAPLRELQEFLQLERQLRAEPQNIGLRQQLANLHDRLLTSSEQLLEPEVLADLTDDRVRQWFAHAVFLLMEIATCVAGDDGLLDTAGCRMLELYEADFLATPEHQQQLIRALTEATELSPDTLAQIQQEVSRATSQAKRKHLVVRAIREEFCLWTDDDGLREGIFGFFSALYPNVGVVAEEVELIVTGTMIFFCLPFVQDKLTTPRYAQLSEAEQQVIQTFLRRVNRFSQYQFSHFPVFGFLRAQDMDAELLQRLAGRCGLSAAEVAAELATLTAIVPLTEMDKYVVHDIWGHSWQACMLGFDDLYIELATYADPLQVEENATSRSGEVARFHDCFEWDGTHVRFISERFEQFVNWEVAERLPVAMTPVLAEVLADVAEFKLLASGQLESLSSTSALSAFPAKLDLTLRDVFFYFRQATKVFRLWANQSGRHQRTVESLVQQGASLETAEQAVREAVAHWHHLEQGWLAGELRYEPMGDQLEVNVASRLALNFLAIHRETLLSYERLDAISVGTLPLKGFRDLLLITVAVFFEASPSVNLWRVDEFISTRIEPLCLKLVAASSRRRG